VMPVGAMATAGQQVFRLVRRLHEELGVNTTCGASNVSFGMPDRERINAAFLPMAIASGLTSAITNPLSAEVKGAVMAADVLMGNDRDAARWIRAHREAAAPAAAAALVGAGAGLSSLSRSAMPVVRAVAPAAISARPRINRRAMAAGNGSSGNQSSGNGSHGGNGRR
jgi:uncharacterized membrane protein YgcG